MHLDVLVLTAVLCPVLLPSAALSTTDSKLLLTACDDMHANLYDVHQGQLIDSFSGAWAAEAGA